MLKIKFAPEVFARPPLMDDPISLHGLDLPPFSPYFPISQILTTILLYGKLLPRIVS
jgi:hypothetical protein